MIDRGPAIEHNNCRKGKLFDQVKTLETKNLLFQFGEQYKELLTYIHHCVQSSLNYIM